LVFVKLRILQSPAQIGRHFAVAQQAKGAEVLEIALTAAFGYGKDMVGIPERPAGVHGAQAPHLQSLGPSPAACALQGLVSLDCVGKTESADAAVAREDLIAQVAWIGTETPLVHAERRTECATTTVQDFQLAPSAERALAGQGRWREDVGVVGGSKATRRMLSGHFPSIRDRPRTAL
jgi:hypothetical protein